MIMIDDEKLLAYLDGELSADEGKRVSEALESDQRLRARLDVQRSLKARLATHYAPIADEQIPDRFRALLEADPDDGEAGQSAEVVNFSAAKQDRDTRRNAYGEWRWPQLGAIAASLAIGLVAGSAIIGGPDTQSSTFAQGLILAADHPLAGALETQLASTQRMDATIRVGITFRNQQGRYCRTFDGPEMEGIACREDGSWQLALAVPDTESSVGSQFRQASSGHRIVLEYAQSIMDGPPVDAGAERQARDDEWSR